MQIHFIDVHGNLLELRKDNNSNNIFVLLKVIKNMQYAGKVTAMIIALLIIKG